LLRALAQNFKEGVDILAGGPLVAVGIPVGMGTSELAFCMVASDFSKSFEQM